MEIEILQRLRAEYINFEIYSFDKKSNHSELFRFSIRIRQTEDGNFYNKNYFIEFKEGVKWLSEQAIQYYPESKFAKWWSENNAN